MHPVRRLAFHVLLQAVGDARRGVSFPAGQMRTLCDWARIAGINEDRLMKTLEWARSGRMSHARPQIDSAHHKGGFFNSRVQETLRRAAP